MNEVALRQRIVALVVAALLAVSGAAVTTSVFANGAHAFQGVGNTGNLENISPDDGGEDIFATTTATTWFNRLPRLADSLS